MAKQGMGYEPYFPASKPHLDEFNALKHNLVRSLEELKVVFENKSDYMALDFETSSLDPTEGFIVGFSVAFDAKEGYYVPVKHGVGVSLGKEALDLLYDACLTKQRVFFYNYRFDARYFHYAGYDVRKIKYYDVAVGLWLADSNIKMPSLKYMEKHWLGWDPETFEQTLGDAKNFYYLDPEMGYRYASCDAVGTFALAPISAKFYKENKLSGKLDNDILYPLMIFEDNGIKVDIKYLQKKIEVLLPRLEEYEKFIYNQIGYTFSLKSGKQLGDALQSVGINTGSFTAKGQMKTDIVTLGNLAQKMDKSKEKEILESIIRYSKLQKLINSFFQSLLDEAIRQNGVCRFSYQTTNVPSGRLSSGSDKKNTYFTHMNVQAISKPHPAMWYVHDGKTIPDEELRPGEIRILDWVFSLDRKSPIWEEGFEQDENIRSAFLPDDGCLWVSIDFNAQELRIPAALSGESTWADPFIHGQDIHKACYSDDTEFLTEDGWKFAPQIGPHTKIAQWDHDKITFVSAGQRYEGDTGELVHFKTSVVDLLVTKNHRIFNGYRYNGEALFTMAEFYVHTESRTRFRQSGVYDGYLDRMTGFRCSEEFFKDLFKIIARTIQENKVPEETTSKVRDYLNDYFFRNGVYRLPRWFMHLKKELRLEFLNSLNGFGTGRKLRGVEVEYACQAKDIQLIAILTGFKCHIHNSNYNGHNRFWMKFYTNITEVPFYKVGLRQYSGKTYCFSVPSGILVVRRNGKVAVCGNTAVKLWGKENYTKDKRKLAKILNFSLQYGGNKYTLQEKLHIDDLDECQKLVDDFQKGLPRLHAWQNMQIKRAKKLGYCQNYFGRIRRVKYYLNHPEGRIRAFGARTVKNTLIQSVGADSIKIVILKLWKHYLDPDLKTGIRFMNTIHDEVNFSIPYNEDFEKNVVNIANMMRLNIPGFPYPMEVGVEIGVSQGCTWAFLVKDGKLVPKSEAVPEEEIEEPVEVPKEEISEDNNIFEM